MIQDTRGQAIGIVRLFAGLIVGAVIYWVVDLATDPVLSRAANASANGTSNQGTAYLQEGVDFLPLFFLILGFFGLIALAVFQRQGGRP